MSTVKKKLLRKLTHYVNTMVNSLRFFNTFIMAIYYYDHRYSMACDLVVMGFKVEQINSEIVFKLYFLHQI